MPADPLAGLPLLVHAVAGRPIEVVTGRRGQPAWTNGTVLATQPGLAAGVVREQALALALLIRAGTLSRNDAAALRLRPRARSRFLMLEVVRAASSECPWLLPHLTVPDGVPVTASTEESIRLAIGPHPLPPTPLLWGRLSHASEHSPDDSALLRLLATLLSGRLSTPPPHSGAATASGAGAGPGAAGIGSASRRRPQPHRDDVRRPTQPRPSAAGGTARLPNVRSVRYPEWDDASGRLVPDWCRVLDFVPADDGQALIPTIHEDHRLRRQLMTLNLALGRVRRQPVGDDLDVDAVVESRVEARTGGLDDNVYLATCRVRRDLAVLVLLDASGSSEEGPEGTRSLHPQHLRLADQLVSALWMLGDRVAAYAFRSQTRHAVHLLRLKGFDDRWGVGPRRRLHAIRPGAYTRLGAAIRHASGVLAQESGMERRVLAVITDGLPYDEGYVGASASADVRHAVLEARRVGVATLGLTRADGRTWSSMQDAFADVPVARLADGRDLADVVAPVFLQALNLTR